MRAPGDLRDASHLAPAVRFHQLDVILRTEGELRRTPDLPEHLVGGGVRAYWGALPWRIWRQQEQAIEERLGVLRRALCLAEL